MIYREGLVDFINCYQIDNKIYFYGRNGAGLCCYDIQLKTLKPNLICFQDEEQGDWFSYVDCVEYDGNLFFSPYLADKILVYNIENNAYRFIDLGFKAFSKKIIYNDNYLYFVCESNKVIKVNTKDDQFIIYTGEINHSLYGDACIYNGKLYWPVKKAGHICEFDLRTDSFSYKKISDRNIVFSTICQVDNSFFMTGNLEYAVKWNPLNDEALYYDFPKEIKKRDIPWEMYFSASILSGNEVVLVPLATDSAMAIDVYSGKMRTVLVVPDDKFSWGIQNVSGSLCLCLQDISSLEANKCILFDRFGTVTNEMNIENNLYRFIRNI